jgi:hypothetical protein
MFIVLATGCLDLRDDTGTAGEPGPDERKQTQAAIEATPVATPIPVSRSCPIAPSDCDSLVEFSERFAAADDVAIRALAAGVETTCPAAGAKPALERYCTGRAGTTSLAFRAGAYGKLAGAVDEAGLRDALGAVFGAARSAARPVAIGCPGSTSEARCDGSLVLTMRSGDGVALFLFHRPDGTSLRLMGLLRWIEDASVTGGVQRSPGFVPGFDGDFWFTPWAP